MQSVITFICYCTAKKDLLFLAIIFFTIFATVYIVLWNDTRISLVIAMYGQYGAHGVATGIIEFAARTGKYI